MPRGFLKTLISWAFTRSKNHGRYWRRLCRYWIVGGCMAYLQRVIFALLVALFTSTAHASFVAPVVTQWKVVNTSVWYPTAQQACNSITGSGTLAGPTCWASNGFSYSLTAGNVPVCPANSTGTTSCTCSAGYMESGTSCVVDPAAAACAAKAGTDAGVYNRLENTKVVITTIPKFLCYSGCAVSVAWAFGVSYPTAAFPATWNYQGRGTYNGSPCVPGADSNGDGVPEPAPVATETAGAPSESACGVGSVRGLLNGISICSPPSDRNTIEAVKSTTATAPVGPASAPGSGRDNKACRRPPSASFRTRRRAG